VEKTLEMIRTNGHLPLTDYSQILMLLFSDDAMVAVASAMEPSSSGCGRFRATDSEGVSKPVKRKLPLNCLLHYSTSSISKAKSAERVLQQDDERSRLTSVKRKNI